MTSKMKAPSAEANRSMAEVLKTAVSRLGLRIIMGSEYICIFGVRVKMQLGAAFYETVEFTAMADI